MLSVCVRAHVHVEMRCVWLFFPLQENLKFTFEKSKPLSYSSKDVMYLLYILSAAWKMQKWQNWEWFPMYVDGKCILFCFLFVSVQKLYFCWFIYLFKILQPIYRLNCVEVVLYYLTADIVRYAPDFSRTCSGPLLPPCKPTRLCAAYCVQHADVFVRAARSTTLTRRVCVLLTLVYSICAYGASPALPYKCYKIISLWMRVSKCDY